MGGRLSSGGNSNADASSDHPGPSAGIAVDRVPRTSTAIATGALSHAATGGQHSQPETSGGATGGSNRRESVSKNARVPDGSQVVNRRQLLEVLAASGVSGRTVVSRSRPPAASDAAHSAEDGAALNRTLLTTSLPFLIAFRDVKCPVCHKMIPSDDVECHLVMCLTKPKIIYNEEILTEDKEKECIICFEDLKQDDLIARLPCLCIYHKSCIDRWFKVSQSCPEHPEGTT